MKTKTGILRLNNRMLLQALFLLFLLFSLKSYSQQGVSINIAATPADPSAMLDVSSATKGLLIPRVALTSINDITTILNPAVSLLVYNTNPSMTGGGLGFWYFNGTIWVQAIGPQGIQGPVGATGAQGPQGPQGNVGTTGATGPLVSGTSGQTLRHDGTTWVANSTIYNNGTNVGIGTSSPTQKLEVTGNTKVSGYIVAGTATTGSTTRYGKQTLTYNTTLTNANTDAYGYSPSIGSITIPSGTTSVTITKLAWECDGAHDDGNEEHGIWVGVGSSASLAAYYGWWASVNNGYHFIDWHWIGTMSLTAASGSNYVYIRTYDEYPTLGGSDYLYVYNMKVTVYYQYSIGLQAGDIAASGRIYANNTTAVGDLAEHLEYKGFVEPGIVVAYVPGSDNEYVQCNEPYSDHIAGVISENPSVVLNSSQQGPPVALAGRVKIKLIASDQLIKGGDFITSSAEAGLGQKATKPGPVIGYAVKNQNPGDDFVEILLQPGKYYIPKSFVNSKIIDEENEQGDQKPRGKW